jgi:uncharacterized membrane protein YphA (DoxX/SURF4 family)
MFTKIARIALGLMLLVFGANKFFQFIPLGEIDDETTRKFLFSLESTGYVFQFVGIMEIGIGTMLLLKKWVPFALIILFPITLNILLSHLMFIIPGISIAILIMLFNIILIYKYREKYKSLFN